MIAGSNDVVEDLLRAIPASSVITRHVGIEAMCNIEMHLDTDRAPVLLALYNQQGNCLSSCRVLAPDMPEMPPHIVTGHSTISVAKPYHKSKPEYTVPASAHVEAIHLDKQGPKPQSLATWLAEMPQEWCTYLLRQLTASQSGPGIPKGQAHISAVQHPVLQNLEIFEMAQHKMADTLTPVQPLCLYGNKLKGRQVRQLQESMAESNSLATAA